MKGKKKGSKRLRLSVLIVFLIGLFSIAGSVSAYSNRFNFDRQTMQTLDRGSTVDGPGFFAGDLVEINGTVDGTTFVSGDLIRVNGDINGSLFVLGSTVQITGDINGNIYGAGQLIQLSGQNDGDAFFAGETVTIEQDAQVGRDLFVAGMNALFEGSVPRHLFAAGQSLTLNGEIGGNANLNSEELTLEDSASIEGDLRYESPNEASLSPSATVAGETIFSQRDSWDREWTYNRAERWEFILLAAVWSVLSALLVWFLIKLFSPHFWKDTVRPIGTQPLKTIGIGAVALLATPFIIVLLLITLIGVPMSILLMMLYGIALYISKIIVALYIGASIFRLFGKENFDKEVFLVLVGLIILELLSLINILDWIIGLIVILTGLGALILSRRPPTMTEDPVHQESRHDPAL
ncbi:polymer-forming cytoskeletal protein [Lacticigenium naphthae]|uniref:polymer-forming cytoskeletal protein n=1 Tax=Lacticigenium naphthae TaxID=515351 RepID=UPI0004212CBD|nr:polymer-forming cytoskeletal protein [Lacticigenium naphthae]